VSKPDPKPDERRAAAIARRRARRAARLARAEQAEQLAPGSEAEAAERNKVLAGKRGWLFLSNDANDVIGQHTGRVKLSPKQIDGWAELTDKRLELMDRLGIAWTCAIVPDKEGMYPEYLPPRITPADRRPIHDLLDMAAERDAPFLYLHDAMWAAKGDRPLYPLTGTHWNHLGAYQGYKAIREHLAESDVETPELPPDSIKWEEYELADDLGRKLEPPRFGASVQARIKDQRSRLTFDNRVMNRGRTVVFEREDGEGPRGLIFADSFAPYLTLFLKESFSRLVFVHSHAIPLEILELEEPDAVVSLTAERFMVRVPTDDTAMAQLRETVESRREKGRTFANVQWVYESIPGAKEVRNDGELPWPDSDSG